jgi:hypothetical protein
MPNIFEICLHWTSVLTILNEYIQYDSVYFCFVSVPMNKIVVGNTPSPNIKKVQSKVGSMANAAHKVTLAFFTYNKECVHVYLNL